MTIVDDVNVLGLNPLARHGLRSKQNVTVVNETRKKTPLMDVRKIPLIPVKLLYNVPQF